MYGCFIGEIKSKTGIKDFTDQEVAKKAPGESECLAFCYRQGCESYPSGEPPAAELRLREECESWSQRRSAEFAVLLRNWFNAVQA
jgi:hypothetical protein